MKSRQIIVQQQSRGYGYRLTMGGEVIGAPGYGDAVMRLDTALQVAREIAQKMDGPTEIYLQEALAHKDTILGNAVPLQVGDRVTQRVGVMDFFGRVVEAANGEPVLMVLTDSGETVDLEGWSYTPRSGHPRP